ncbi:DsbA family oxidoreductase [Streptomyces sp. NPDC059639]|uniref:DsbA family oxidoreductase n=1 Tax=Streptomyces sp. NPDC059639 TaxID=3346891 RepID=UPI0036886C91
MKIEIWSDIMCPWCYIGKARLAKALERLDGADDVDVVWRSFELRPEQPREPGATLGEMMRQRLGLAPDAAVDLFEKIAGLGRELGLDIRLTGVRPVNSFDAQRLVHLAAEEGLADVVKEELFHAYLTENLNVADHEVLADLAKHAGLDPAEVRRTLRGDAYAAEVRADESLAARRGVSGVPSFFVDGVPVGAGVPTVEELHRALVRAR